jgi:uncharacterized SAM-binding protein YcdF (DUF218 family)
MAALESVLFMAKKLVSRLLFPVEFILLLGLAGCIWCAFRRGSRFGMRLIVLSFVLLFFFSTYLAGYILTMPLERRAGGYADPAVLVRQGVDKIVVLSGSFPPGRSDPGGPAE